MNHLPFGVRITSAADLDDKLRAWLRESHDVVGMQSDLAERRVGQAKSRRRRAVPRSDS